jgi:hypothetical protein
MKLTSLLVAFILLTFFAGTKGMALTETSTVTEVRTTNTDITYPVMSHGTKPSVVWDQQMAYKYGYAIPSPTLEYAYGVDETEVAETTQVTTVEDVDRDAESEMRRDTIERTEPLTVQESAAVSPGKPGAEDVNIGEVEQEDEIDALRAQRASSAV